MAKKIVEPSMKINVENNNKKVKFLKFLRSFSKRLILI